MLLLRDPESRGVPKDQKFTSFFHKRPEEGRPGLRGSQDGSLSAALGLQP